MKIPAVAPVRTAARRAVVGQAAVIALLFWSGEGCMSWRASTGDAVLRIPWTHERFSRKSSPSRWTMSKLLILLGASVGGAIGWWLGARVGIMTAFVVSMLGTGIGVYVGRRIATSLAE
jgi:hypothetical protein